MADANLRIATLDVQFATDTATAANDKIILEQLTKRFDHEGRLWIRVYASNFYTINYIASLGTVTLGEKRVLPVTETLKFSGSSSVSLKYPGVVTADLTPFVLMEKVTDNHGDTEIRLASGVTLYYDAEENSVVARSSASGVDAKLVIYGACKVEYETTYQMVYYIPQSTRILTGGIVWGVGSLFAYNNKVVEVLDLELDIKTTPDWVEYARVTSKIVLDPVGTWEFPNNWKSTYNANRNEPNPNKRTEIKDMGVFEGFNGYEIDPDRSFVDTRVHCIVYANAYGDLRYEDFNNGGDGYWAWYTPYFGISTYDPDYELEYVAPPGGEKASSAEDFQYDLNHRTWRDAFLDVDKEAMKEKLRKQYPGCIDNNRKFSKS